MRIAVLSVIVMSLTLSACSPSSVPGCFSVLSWGRHLIETPDTYMSTWRYIDPRAPGPPVGPPFSEGYYREPVSSLGGQWHEYVPTRFTLFAVIREMYQVADGTLSREAAIEAIDALSEAAMARSYTLGEGEIISHEDAMSLFDDAADICIATGKAELPVVELGE